MTSSRTMDLKRRLSGKASALPMDVRWSIRHQHIIQRYLDHLACFLRVNYQPMLGPAFDNVLPEYCTEVREPQTGITSEKESTQDFTFPLSHLIEMLVEIAVNQSQVIHRQNFLFRFLNLDRILEERIVADINVT